MLVLEAREGEQLPARTLSFTRHALGIGRSLPGLTLGGDIGLEASFRGVRKDHVELFECEGHLHCWPLQSIVLDGEPVSGRGGRPVGRASDADAKLHIGSKLGLGATTIVVLQFTPIAPPDFDVREGELLHPIDADRFSVGARLVYSDALEERGFLIRAEYLRVQLRLLLGEALEGDAGAKQRFLKNLVPAWRWVERVGEPLVADSCQMKAGRACPVAWGLGRIRPSACVKCDRAVRYPMATKATTT